MVARLRCTADPDFLANIFCRDWTLWFNKKWESDLKKISFGLFPLC